MNSYFSTPDSYERVYLSFDPMHRLMRERNITDLELARKVGVKVDVIRNIYKYQDTVTLSMVRSICEALDCGPGDLMTAMKAICIPAKKRSPGRLMSVRVQGGYVAQPLKDGSVTFYVPACLPWRCGFWENHSGHE